METVDDILSIMVEQMTTSLCQAIDEQIIVSMMADDLFKKVTNMSLEWKLQAFDDLSGCWLHCTNFDVGEENELVGTQEIDIGRSTLEFGYEVHMAFGGGAFDGGWDVTSPCCDSLDEAKQMAEDMLTGFCAQALVDYHNIIPEVVIV